MHESTVCVEVVERRDMEVENSVEQLETKLDSIRASTWDWGT
jgi:hypothetical protein